MNISGSPAPQRTRHHRPPPLPAVPVHPDLGMVNPMFWWVGCHGGAGISTLNRLTGIGYAYGPYWPAFPPNSRIWDVILVCRGTAAGLWAATGAVDQWRNRSAPTHVRVQGIVVVAGSEKRPPKIVTERIQLLKGWVPNVWQVGWQEVFLSVDDPIDIGSPPPDVAALRQSIIELFQVPAR